MTIFGNLIRSLACLVLDALTGQWGKWDFHAAGLKRALVMTMQTLSDRAAAPAAITGGSAGLVNVGLSAWHVASEIGQMLLLVLSIFSVLIGLYIAWPKFVRVWHDNGGLKILRRGSRTRTVEEDDDD